MEITLNSRGFKTADFVDLDGEPCSIKESSLATENAIWLGLNEGTHVRGSCLARMHLTQEMVSNLLPTLKYFAKHGQLPG